MRKIWSDHSGNRIFVVSLHLLFSETVRLTSPDIKNEMATKYDDYNPEIYYEDKQSEAERSPEKPVVSETGQNVRRKKNGNSNGARRKKVRDAKKDGAETFVSKVKEWAGSLNVRLLLGIFLGFLGVYLTISFISYVSSCIDDMAAIESMSIGTAKDIRNAGGEGGARLSDFLINRSFGLGSVVILVWLYGMTLKLLAGRPRFKSVDFTIKCVVALLIVSMVVGFATIASDSVVNWGGYDGRYVNEFIISFVGWSGAVIVCLFLIAVFVVICLRDIVKWVLKIKKARDARLAEKRAAEEEERRRLAVIEEMAMQERIDAAISGENVQETEDVDPEDSFMRFEPGDERHDDAVNDNDSDEYVYKCEDQDEPEPEAVKETPLSEAAETPVSKDGCDGDTMVVNVNTIAQSDGLHPRNEPGITRYRFPSADLLRPGETKISVDTQEQEDNQQRIRKTLLDFGIPIVSIEATVGPTVTLYEIVPDKGVKIARIRNLVDDIALSLSAIGVRIIAPIPGRGTVGIEVANKDPQVVSMRTVIQSKKFADSRYKLPIALGSTISNDVFIADLAKMPHLLVAGATGQGKSVGLNAIISSLLYRKRPDELKFVMIDPKMVEFSLYAKIEKHYLAKLPDEEEPIITDMSKAVATLSSLCVEMDNRYQLLKGNSRNVEEYNEKVKSGRLSELEGHRYLPYIVVIVDEFSDLIMTAGKEVEMPIARLAQKARAVGIHVIIATQRPSTNVITGIIKANFPARIAFKVSSGVDSKTILDTTGAQQLIGRGDMLVSNNSEMTRVQCAFIDTPEVESICEYVSRQPYPQGAYILPEPVVSGSDDLGGHGSSFAEDRDPLFEEIARRVIQSNTASTSAIQRSYSIGYNRAGRIMDQLEAAGIVGPSTGGKPRSVLVDAMGLESILSQLH